MPITQPRMLELISAAQDYKRALEQVCEFINRQREHVDRGAVSPADAWALVSQTASPQFLLGEPLKSAMTILLEAKHFQSAGKKNFRKAQKLRENRAAERAGGPRPQRGTTAPASQLTTRQLPKRSLVEELHGVGLPVQLPPTTIPQVHSGFAAETTAITADDELVLDITPEEEAPPPPPLVPDDEIQRLLTRQAQDEAATAFAESLGLIKNRER